MFSEYASRFLAQSQSRLSLSQNEPANSTNPLDRHRGSRPSDSSRAYLQRRAYGNPYASGTASQTSRFPFAARASQVQAPLFYSATDEFREEDDGQEHEREAADFYALQRSRRDFGAEHLSESSDDDRPSEGKRRKGASFPAGGRGIRSSWTGDEQDFQNKPDVSDDTMKKAQAAGANFGSFLGRTRDRLVDVELASTIQEADESETGLGATHDADPDENPPSLQHFRRTSKAQSDYRDNSLGQSESAPFLRLSRTDSADGESGPAREGPSDAEHEKFDSFWGTLFLVDMVSLFATFFLVVLHTSAPKNSSRLGDTIYATMTSSFYLLGVDTVVAVAVALIWIAALRSFVRPLVFLMLAAVPIIAVSFSLYPFISSFGGKWDGNSIQDRVMRWVSLLPAIFAFIWVYTAYKGRHSLDRAISLLQFTTRILAACPTLIIVGFSTLLLVVSWTWIWMLMFTRVFLGGHVAAGKLLFIIDTSTWWLGAFFVLTYLWSLGVISGIQRATTAATTSQWYFYRNAIPAPSPQSVVRAALAHATTKVFGTICLSALMALAVRVPLLVLPARISGYLSLCLYSVVPASVTTLTNPLTLTYAAIHSQPLTLAARGLSELVFVAPTGTTATTALTPRAFSQPYPNNHGTPSLLAYRLAKLLLHATRLVTSMAFGFGGWVSTARMLTVEDSSMRGSLYAYVVGLIAGAIGWAVLGAVEGVLGGVLDAVVICWGSEMQSHGTGQARFCREAGELLADEGTVAL